MFLFIWKLIDWKIDVSEMVKCEISSLLLFLLSWQVIDICLFFYIIRNNIRIFSNKAFWQSAALSSAIQHPMPPVFERKWGTECLNTRFLLPTLIYLFNLNLLTNIILIYIPFYLSILMSYMISVATPLKFINRTLKQ